MSAGRVAYELLSGFAALGLARRRRLSIDRTDLPMLPSLDRRATESPRAANSKARDASLTEQSVNRRRMHAKMRRQLGDGQNFFFGCHRDEKITVSRGNPVVFAQSI